MKRVYILAWLLVGWLSAFAQKTGKRPDFYMIPQAGLLNGEQSTSAQVMLVAGLESKGWGLGLGSGFDYYKVRTIPLFADIRKTLGKNTQPVFVYADLGLNIAVPVANQYERPFSQWGNRQSSFRNGWYGEFGIGYALLNKKRRGVVLGLGYSIKTHTERYDEMIFQDFPPYTGTTIVERSFLYNYKRVVLKLGFRL